MGDTAAENKLKQCLEECITVVERIITKLNLQGPPQLTAADPALDVNIHTFTLDTGEETLMCELKVNLENVLTDRLPMLSKYCRKYLLDFLYQINYDYEKRKFTSSFNRGIIDSFLRDLQSRLASINAFQAAWDGNIPAVKEFIKKYPTVKDQSGLWGTTLLYSAARNNHLKLVEYLLKEAKCSVNAQNQQHIMRALPSAGITDDQYDVNPTAGSTALHGACFKGHLQVVKFLIEQGADCFIVNHSHETPITNAHSHPDILQYFRDILIVDYSSQSTTLPEKPIVDEDNQKMTDCVWEYKPCADQQWFRFSGAESKKLQEALKIKPNQEFELEIYLTLPQGIYSVSMMKFLLEGKDLNYTQQLAWVRCRGSSILNFNCYPLWQIMFTTYPKGLSDSTLQMLNIPTIYDSKFQIHLHSWYFCDARTNNQLEQTMNYHRKFIDLTIPFISDGDSIKFDLQNFSFSNQANTIKGYIRWIPKMISNNAIHKDKIIGVDQYGTLANMNIIPLTTTRLKQVSELNTLFSEVKEELEDNINGDDDDDSSIINSDPTIDTSDKLPETPFQAPQSLNEMLSDMTQSSISTRSNSLVPDYEPEKHIDNCINETAANSRPIAALIERLQSSKTNNELTQLIQENENLLRDLEYERAIASSLMNAEVEQTTKHEQQLSDLLARINMMENQQNENEIKQTKLEQIANTIKTIEYTNIQKEIIHDFLTPKCSSILDYLRSQTVDLDPSFTDRIPKMTFAGENDRYTVTIVGFQEHHNEFKAILRRIWSLLNVIQSAKDFYQRDLNRSLRLMTKDTLPKVIPRTQIWREYTQLFTRLFQEKSIEYKKNFDDYIQEKLKSLIDACIFGELVQPWIEIRKETDDFLKNHSFMNEIESIKHKALEEFIKQNISMQHLKLEVEPTAKSISVIRNFIEKIQREFQTNKKYQGYQIHHFNYIPKLLERLMLYYCSFKIQLPLYECSEDLLDKIDKNAITTISTSTGSGKSTLLPALLVAEGYDKVIVTQPRRLPCQLICKRVNETMTIDVGPDAKKLAGWAVSGTEKNPQAKVLYLTDGLLKERLLYDDNFLTINTQLNKSVVFFIDEVHERSVNIDLCLAFLARLLTIKPELKTKMKVIISSATLDSSVPNLFRGIPQAGLAEFKMPQMGTLHPVTKFHRPNENVLDIVQELCKKRKRRDQILCFVNSVTEVNQCCRLIGEISRGTIVAYPLVQSQHPNVQQTNIEHGTVFFSTTVAETSLTFPSLKYVVDTGMINTPVYDIDSKRTILKEVRAAESTIKQRLGRLGRTQPGEYYSLYNFVVDHVPFPIPQICQSDLINLEFSLRKSPLKQGLHYIQRFLPDKPSPKAINTTIDLLKQLGILEKGPNDRLTKHGEALAKLPDFGSLAMSKSVLAALSDYHCGYDLIVLSSILGVLNTTIIFKSIPQNLKSPDGDFMTLLNVMNEILLIKKSIASHQFDLDLICQKKGLGGIQHILRQALRRYETLEKLFNQSDAYRERAQIKSGNWELIAKAFLAGYADNVFVSMKELQDRNLSFARYNGQDNTVAILDLQSTLTRPINIAPVSLVLARDIRHSTAIRATAIISFVGEIKSEWLEHPIERQVDLKDEEDTYMNNGNKYSNAASKFAHRISMLRTKDKISLKGSCGVVLDAELHLRQEMISEIKFTLKELGHANPHENFAKNLKSVMKMTRIFNPMKWRWQAQKQVEITINSNTATDTCEIIVKGRDSENRKVKQEFRSFVGWLQNCAVIKHPNSGVSPRVLRPQMRKTCQDIEERIARITDSKRTPIDLYNGAKGAKATRETRMEVVGWIAVCKFDCRLEGGFVRDWIVGHYIQRPAHLTNPQSWIETTSPVPTLNKEVVPCDLDCHLPSHAYFDISKFQDELYKYGITCSVYREDWRYVLLFDENETTGPFTMDLIEPHVALTHDRIDFDVSNLSLEKDYTHELGMRIDVTQKPYSIELETIVDNIKNKLFQILRPIDKHLQDRIKKMNLRGWKETGEKLSIIPEPHWKHNVILVPLPKSAVLYIDVSNKMSSISGIRIISIEQIRNPFLEETYEGMKKLIKKQCTGANPNEQELFHGTKGDGINGIIEDGFDDRFFNSAGMYGKYK
jgi:HrpA-like RNA helicase